MSPVEDELFDRAVCHDATDRDWESLERLASRDPEVWRRLALALRDQGDLVQAMGELSGIADRVALPPPRRAAWGAALSVAALMLLGLGAWWLQPPAAVPVEETAAHIEHVGELPSVLVNAKPLPDGQGVEVTYVRRLVERRTTAALLEQAEDEWGQPTVVPADLRFTTTQEL